MANGGNADLIKRLKQEKDYVPKKDQPLFAESVEKLKKAYSEVRMHTTIRQPQYTFRSFLLYCNITKGFA